MDLPTIPINSKRILILENDERIRKSMVRDLEIEGYLVQQADLPAAALRSIQHIRPDLIIANISLADENHSADNSKGEKHNSRSLDPTSVRSTGEKQPSFLKTVRSNPALTAIPFIFLMRRNNAKDAQRARDLGVEDFLPNQPDNSKLVRIVHARLLRSTELQVALIDQAYLETIEVLANTVEGRDPYTHGHIGRVSMYAHWLAEALNWPKEQLRTLAFGARLHDIGKIVIPDHILKKPGELTEDEWELMKQHPAAGSRILRDIKHLRDATNYVLYHHERWDGSGYPHGLTGRDIPVEGRLLAIADVFDALTTDRPYHPAQPRGEVLRFLHQQSGSRFDPDLVPIFINVLENQMRL